MARKSEEQAAAAPAEPIAAAAQKPTVGRIVHYTMSQQHADVINAARKKAMADLRSKTGDQSVAPARQGNVVNEGDKVAMVIVAVWSDTCVNGQLLLDGNDSHWVTSVNLGDTLGHWSWPART